MAFGASNKQDRKRLQEKEKFLGDSLSSIQGFNTGKQGGKFTPDPLDYSEVLPSWREYRTHQNNQIQETVSHAECTYWTVDVLNYIYTVYFSHNEKVCSNF